MCLVSPVLSRFRAVADDPPHTQKGPTHGGALLVPNGISVAAHLYLSEALRASAKMTAETLRYALVLFGMIHITAQSTLFHPLRRVAFKRWKTAAPGVRRGLGGFALGLVVCSPCLGFWFGVVAYALGYWPLPSLHAGWLEAGVGSCALGALWGVWGPESPPLEDE